MQRVIPNQNNRKHPQEEVLINRNIIVKEFLFIAVNARERRSSLGTNVNLSSARQR